MMGNLANGPLFKFAISRKALTARVSLGINDQISIIPAAPRVHNYSPQELTLL